MASATGPQARLRAQAITNFWPIYSSGSVWLFGILGDWSYSPPSSYFPDDSRITFEQNLSVFSDGCRLPRTTSKALQFLGLRVECVRMVVEWCVVVCVAACGWGAVPFCYYKAGAEWSGGGRMLLLIATMI